MSVHRRKFKEVEVLVVSQRGYTNVALDDVAQALGIGLAMNVEPVIKVLGLEPEVYESPMVPRGSVKMISLTGALFLLSAIDAPRAREFEAWLTEDATANDRSRLEDLPMRDAKRLHVGREVRRMLEQNPDLSPVLVAELLKVSEAAAAEYIAFGRLLLRIGSI